MKFDTTQPLLPVSLRKKRNRNILIRCILCFVFLLIIFFVIIMWGNKLFPTGLQHHKGFKGLQVMFYMLLLVVPFVITGVPLKFIDTSWSGIITGINVKDSTGSYFVGGRLWPYAKHNLVLTIEKKDGTVFEYTAISFGDKERSCAYDYFHSGEKIYYQLEDFCVGDKVYKYYGFKHLYIIHPNSQVCNCIVCGAKCNKLNEKCFNCNSEIIK